MRDKPFADRSDAGRKLASALGRYRRASDLLVLGIPRGGVPVAFEVAAALDAPLDVFTVRKLGTPGHPELAIGAVATGGIVVLNEALARALAIPRDTLEALIGREADELARRERAYRSQRPPPDVRGHTVIVVDDGLATGASMLAAVRAIRKQEPARIVVAVPIASRDTCDRVREDVDDLVCLLTPEPFFAVGLWYEDFSQTTDDEVRELLAEGHDGERERERLPGPRSVVARGG